jgi:hypothetical protein
MLRLRDGLVEKIEEVKENKVKLDVLQEFELHFLKINKKSKKKVKSNNLHVMLWQRFKECEVFYDFIVFYINFRDSIQVGYKIPIDFMEKVESMLSQIHSRLESECKGNKVINEKAILDLISQIFGNFRSVSILEFISHVNTNPMDSIIKDLTQYPSLSATIPFAKQRESMMIYKTLYKSLPTDIDVFQQCREAMTDTISQKSIRKWEKHKIQMEEIFQKEDILLQEKMDDFLKIGDEILMNVE